MRAFRRAFALGALAACASSAWAQDLAWIPQYVPGPHGAYQSVGMAYDSARQVVVFFGSSWAGGRTWEWNGEGWRDRGPGGPQDATPVAMAYDAARGVSVLQSTQGTWEWDGEAWTRRLLSGWDGWTGCSLVYDEARAQVVRHGGAWWASRDSTTNVWSGQQWELRARNPALGRAYHATAFDSARGVTVMFGGDASAYMCGDTWEWDGLSWTLRTFAGPSLRGQAVMCYHPGLSLSILNGGRNGASAYHDTWAWDGTAWRQLAIALPPVLQERMLVFDGARGVPLLMGRAGAGSNNQWQMWTLCPPCDVVAPLSQPQAVHTFPGGTAVLTVGTTGTAVSYQWMRDGVRLTDDGHVSGSSTSTLAVSGLGVGDVGVYECLVRGACNLVRTEPASVDCRPLILSQPEGGRLEPNMRLSIEVPAGAEYGYRWKRGGVALVDVPGVIVGTATRSLTLVTTGAELAGWYEIAVGSECGEASSTPVLVRRRCMEMDYSGDGNVDQDDIEAWIGCVSSGGGCPYDPDVNQDDNIDQDDIVAMINVIAGGPCP